MQHKEHERTDIMKILISGAAGFIGTNFVYYMLDAHPDYKLIGYDALTYAGNIGNLAEALKNPSFTFIKGDICDRDAVYRLFQDHHPDIVVNLAAESHVDRSIENPEIFLQTNVVGTSVLMDACAKYGIRRFHQVSTDEVYGDLPLDSNEKFTEESPLRPSSPYSASKAAADLLTLAYRRTYGLPITISRCSNNYGPYQNPEKLIPKTIMLAEANQPIPIYGTGENIRDWIHVKDHCRAIDAIIHQGKDGEIYNVGGDNEISNINLVRKILRTMNKPESLIIFVEDRKGHDRRYAIDSSKLSDETGWSISDNESELCNELLNLIS